MKKNIVPLVIIAIIMTSTSCSTQPKNKGDIFTLRNHAEAGLEQGNREAGRGNSETALRIITESKRNAILTDDTSLIIRCCLSRGNILFDMKRTEEAFSEWQMALDEAQRSNNSELLAVSNVFYARGMLLSGRDTAQNVLDEINRRQAFIKTDRLSMAFCWQVKGLAFRALGRYSDAENAFKQSLEIHEKNMYLENASFDWYNIASIRSVAENFDGALQALQSSIAIDRRIENSWGLAASYRAMGDIYRRKGDNQPAQEAYARAIRIYEALGNAEEAAETRRRMN